MLDPGRIISSVTSFGSTPGGTKSTVLANLAVSEGGGGAAELENACRWRLVEEIENDVCRGKERERLNGFGEWEMVGSSREDDI